MGAVAGTLVNDIDGGDIGTAQYDTWVANFGASLRGASQSVPEPSVVMLLGLAIGSLAQRHL